MIPKFQVPATYYPEGSDGDATMKYEKHCQLQSLAINLNVLGNSFRPGKHFSVRAGIAKIRNYFVVVQIRGIRRYSGTVSIVNPQN